MLKALPLLSSLKFVAPFLNLQQPSTPPSFLLHSAAAALTRVPSDFTRASSSFTAALTRVPSDFTRASSSFKMDSESYTFGPYKIDPREVFYSTQLSYALVNLRPLLPGHVLVCPRREVKRFLDLSADETCDLWLTAQKVGRQLESYHNASSLTFAIQDGPQAGQTVPHVHIHILPRKIKDIEKNDEIYDAIDSKEKELKQTLDLDKERIDRSIAEMAEEADEYRKLFL